MSKVFLRVSFALGSVFFLQLHALADENEEELYDLIDSVAKGPKFRPQNILNS
jgi:hypothetical protein